MCGTKSREARCPVVHVESEHRVRRSVRSEERHSAAPSALIAQRHLPRAWEGCRPPGHGEGKRNLSFNPLCFGKVLRPQMAHMPSEGQLGRKGGRRGPASAIHVLESRPLLQPERSRCRSRLPRADRQQHQGSAGPKPSYQTIPPNHPRKKNAVSS